MKYALKTVKCCVCDSPAELEERVDKREIVVKLRCTKCTFTYKKILSAKYVVK